MLGLHFILFFLDFFTHTNFDVTEWGGGRGAPLPKLRPSLSEKP